MFKIIILMKRRPGISMEDFVAYYEGVHAKLGARFMSPHATRYVRNYLGPMENPLTGKMIEPEHDVVTEVCFPDRETWAAAMAVFSRPEVSSVMNEDEERLFDRSRSRMMIVESVCETEFCS